MVRQPKSQWSTSTGESADCIESHPWQSGIFALGTYQVTQHEDEGEGAAGKDRDGTGGAHTSAPPFSRKGTLRLVEAGMAGYAKSQCRYLQEIPTAAILDMKWLHPQRQILSVATADASLRHFKYKGGSADTRPAGLEPVSHIVLNNKKALCLSLDWSDRTGGYLGGYPDEPPSISTGIVSQSDGTLAHIPSLEHMQHGSQAVETWHAHDYEAWIAAFDCWSHGRIVWSGGDDLTLKGWDMRTPLTGGDSSASDDSHGTGSTDGAQRTPTFAHSKSFEGGVTSLQSHHLVEHLWAVGSYDAHVCLFDARNTMRPLSKMEVGGGVWRLKWHPFEANKLLAGCMHDGFKILQLDALAGSCSNGQEHEHGTPFVAWDNAIPLPREEMRIATRFDEHESLAYGCDWDRGSRLQDAAQDTVYSCSFYDARLHGWHAS